MRYQTRDESLTLTQYTLTFAPPENSQEMIALDWLREMTLSERTKANQRAYEAWYNDQLKALQAVYGD